MKPTNVARGAVFLLAGFIGLGSSVGLLGAEEGTKPANREPETATPAKDSAALERISARMDGKSSVVRLEGAGLGEAKGFFADPLRFVIDLPGAQAVVKAPRIEGKSPVQKIRVGRHAGAASKVRIVLDLRGPSAVEEISRTASSIELRVTRDAKSRYAKAESASVMAAQAPEAAAPSAAEKTEGAGGKSAEAAQASEPVGTGGGAQATAQPSEAPSSVVAASEGSKTSAVKPEKVSDTSSESAKASGAGDQTSVAKTEAAQQVETSKSGDAKAKADAQAGLGFKGDAGASLAASEAPAAVAAPETGPKFDTTIGKAGPEYTGKRISLDFQDADIKNVLRLIAEVSGFNLITSDEVQGKVTVKLLNVPWDHALDIILKTKGLGEVREGTIIRVAPVAALTKEKEDEGKRRVAEAAAEPTVTRIVTLNFARAKVIEPTLRKSLGPRGDMTIDERTNTLIIKDVSKTAEQIAELAKTLDRQTPQVLIEARIVEVSTNYLRELGIQWGGHYVRDAAHGNALPYRFPNSVGIASAQTGPQNQNLNDVPGQPLSGVRAETAGGVTGRVADGTGNAFAVNLPAAVAPGAGGAIGFSIGSIANILSLDVILSALENTGKLKIISNPKVATLDNGKATIKSGRKIPYKTTSQQGTETKFIDAVLELTVTPHITDDKHIDMEIKATKNEADFSYQVEGTPTITIKEAETKLLVKDNDTIVLGGVFKTSESKSKAGLPWLSEIPVLGWLFKKEAQSQDNEELLIFITPKIIKAAA